MYLLGKELGIYVCVDGGWDKTYDRREDGEEICKQLFDLNHISLLVVKLFINVETIVEHKKNSEKF